MKHEAKITFRFQVEDKKVEEYSSWGTLTILTELGPTVLFYNYDGKTHCIVEQVAKERVKDILKVSSNYILNIEILSVNLI